MAGHYRISEGIKDVSSKGFPDPVIHRRTVQFNKSKNVIKIDDLIDCKDALWSSSFFISQPECEVTKAADNVWLIKGEFIEVKRTCSQDFETEVRRGEIEPPLGWYSKSFGHMEPSSVFEAKPKNSRSKSFYKSNRNSNYGEIK